MGVERDEMSEEKLQLEQHCNKGKIEECGIERGDVLQVWQNIKGKGGCGEGKVTEPDST